MEGVKLLRCSKCICHKPDEAFRIRPDRPRSGKRRGRFSSCKDCEEKYRKLPKSRELQNERVKRSKNRLRTRNLPKLRQMERRQNLKRNYGMTLEDYESLVTLHNGVCAICGEKPTKGRGKKLHIDHDHATGKIRGLLCGQCNSALGNFKDNVAILKSAIKYLRKNS